jgi:hypothetical protein
VEETGGGSGAGKATSQLLLSRLTASLQYCSTIRLTAALAFGLVLLGAIVVVVLSSRGMSIRGLCAAFLAENFLRAMCNGDV